ncbi:hypothetical protein TNCV_701782 [Trichonephila clavipes]|nr:hypothetical protein TNCV_701782 [Trichonephila clavipes]
MTFFSQVFGAAWPNLALAPLKLIIIIIIITFLLSSLQDPLRGLTSFRGLISQPPNSVIDTAPTTSNSLSISAASSSSQSVIPPPSDSYKVQDAKKLAKARSRKRKKELLKKMKEAIVDIKMNPHKPKKPASDESTSDEEEMIVYDVEDEIESNPDYVKENGKTYYKGQLLLTPTKHRK